jgi:hypothetical protein
MSTEFLQEEYKLLRHELEGHVEETLRLERYAVIGVAAVFAWLLAELEQEITPWAWYVPVILPLIGGVRSLLLYRHVGLIARYLSRLEVEIYADRNRGRDEERILGWERFLTPRRRKYRGALATIIWIALIGLTVFFSYQFAGASPPACDTCIL